MTAPPENSERPIVIVSNRGPVRFERDASGALVGRRGAGGLVSGIGPLVAGTDARWLAAAMSDDDRAASAQGLVDAEGFHVHLLDIDADTFRLAYDGVSNEALWFAHHGLWDLTTEPSFGPEWGDAWRAYRDVNEAFADAVAADAPEGAVILVQDYHLCLLAEPLRQSRPDLATVHFSHTPFAPPTWLQVLPDAATTELLTGMAAHDACGFHTEQWATDFRDSARVLAGLEPTTFVSPLASDPDDIRAAAASPACNEALARLNEVVGDRLVIGRVDRIELSKNLLRGFEAYDLLLETHPELRERVVFAASAYPSREGVPKYAAYRKAIEEKVASVNERWGTPSWAPIDLDLRDDFPASVALLRRADVLFVNPIRDGLNLVASEGALVNEREAVLALSPQAGAWERLHPAALRVPPYDVAGSAAVLHEALTMPADERSRRAKLLRELAEARTPRDWLADQVAAARPAGI